VARISYITAESAPPDLAHLFEGERPRNIPGLMAHATGNVGPLSDYLLSLLSKQQLDPRVRELCILYNARLSECEYEWAQHESFAAVVGVTREEVDSVARHQDPSSCFEGQARVALALTKELVETGTAQPETIQAALGTMSEQELTELILAVVTYRGLATFMKALAIDPEEGMSSQLASDMAGVDSQAG